MKNVELLIEVLFYENKKKFLELKKKRNKIKTKYKIEKIWGKFIKTNQIWEIGL